MAIYPSDYASILQLAVEKVEQQKLDNRVNALIEAKREIRRHLDAIKVLEDNISLAEKGDWSKLVNEYMYNLELE